MGHLLVPLLVPVSGLRTIEGIKMKYIEVKIERSDFDRLVDAQADGSVILFRNQIKAINIHKYEGAVYLGTEQYEGTRWEALESILEEHSISYLSAYWSLEEE